MWAALRECEGTSSLLFPANRVVVNMGMVALLSSSEIIWKVMEMLRMNTPFSIVFHDLSYCHGGGLVIQDDHHKHRGKINDKNKKMEKRKSGKI